MSKICSVVLLCCDYVTQQTHTWPQTARPSLYDSPRLRLKLRHVDTFALTVWLACTLGNFIVFKLNCLSLSLCTCHWTNRRVASHSVSWLVGWTDRRTHRQTNRQTGKEKERKTIWQAHSVCASTKTLACRGQQKLDKQAGKQTSKQTNVWSFYSRANWPQVSRVRACVK